MIIYNSIAAGDSEAWGPRRWVALAEGMSSVVVWGNASMPRRMMQFSRRLLKEMERETGIEPATSSLGSSRSTAELLPLQAFIVTLSQGSALVQRPQRRAHA